MSTDKSSQFQLVEERGWKRGLRNLQQGEYSAWFKSSKWWKHIIMWFSIVNLMMVIMVIASKEPPPEGAPPMNVLFMYGIFGGMFVAFGVMIIMQRVIIGEKRDGTAAWVLSKPVTRTAFVVSRLVVNSVAILLTSVIIPGIILYITLGLLSDLGWLPPLGFAAAVLMGAIHSFYWTSLVLMMGTLSESSSGVMAVPMALYFVFWMGSGLLPFLLEISPLMLVFSPDESINSIAMSFMTGEPVGSWLPLISTIIFCIVFITVAIRRFNRQEF